MVLEVRKVRISENTGYSILWLFKTGNYIECIVILWEAVDKMRWIPVHNTVVWKFRYNGNCVGRLVPFP